MMVEPSKEATLREVLAEVSVADLGPMLKRWLANLGCLGVFAVGSSLIGVASDATGIKFPNWGIPSWVLWVLIAWLFCYEFTSNKSFHKFEASWYFPKLGWFGSLLLAAYGVGFIYLLILVWHLDEGLDRWLATFAVWFGYLTPFSALVSVTNLGHSKLMEKRRAEIGAADNV